MKQTGINRVVYAVEDFEAGKAFFEKTLGATFHESTSGEAASFGVRAAMAFDVGIELVAPLPDQPSTVRDHINERGEGLYGVVFAVKNLDATRDAFADVGVSTFYSLDYDQTIIDERLEGRFSTYKEHFLQSTPPLSGVTLIGEFSPAEPPAPQ